MSASDNNRLLPAPVCEDGPILAAIPARSVDVSLDGTGQGLIASAAPAISLADELMAESQTSSPDAPSSGGIVCPFCAHIRPDAVGSCPKCTMEDTPSTRRSTGERIGPWFVLQRKNPTAPGLRLSVLLTLARRGHVTSKSIVRGPTTGQFWRYAAQVKGLSRVFGLCWHCGASVSPDAATCPKCRSAQEIPDDPDQFLESHAALPVMREVPPRELEALEPESVPDRTFPSSRRELPDQRAPLGARELAPRDPRSTPGTRSVTLARGEEDVILSASELAAAFQLDMPQQGLVRRNSHRVWRVMKAAALLALLVGGGAATAFHFRPEWYQLAKDYSLPYVEQGRLLVARVAGKAKKTPAALEDVSGLPPITPIELAPVADGNSLVNPDANAMDAKPSADLNQTALTPLTRPRGLSGPTTSSTPIPSVVDNTAAIDALGGGTSVFVPTTRPASTPAQAVADFPKIVDNILAKQDAARTNEPTFATPPAPRQSAPSKPGPSAADMASMPLEEAIKTAADLRTSALDAEARKDWSAAVIIYEQIAKLPEGAHPSDLKVKLAVARDRAKS